MRNSDFAAIADEFGLGPIEAVTRPMTGTMNETYLLRLNDRSVVLRKHRWTDRHQIEYEHEIMEHARRRGIPVPAALLTRRRRRSVRL